MKVSSVKNHWLFLILCVSLIFLFILDRKSLLRKNLQYPITASFYPNHSYLFSPNIFNLQNQSVDFATKSLSCYQLSVDHPALKRKMTRQMSPAPITITRDHTTHGALTLISAAHSPRVVNPDLNTFFNCSVFLFKSQKSLTLHSLSI